MVTVQDMVIAVSFSDSHVPSLHHSQYENWSLGMRLGHHTLYASQSWGWGTRCCPLCNPTSSLQLQLASLFITKKIKKYANLE